MNVIVLLILASLALALGFLAGFVWAVKSGQFDDTCTPSMRILGDEPSSPKNRSGTPSLGSTGDPPVPSGDSPDGMAKALSHRHAPDFATALPAVPVGESLVPSNFRAGIEGQSASAIHTKANST